MPAGLSDPTALEPTMTEPSPAPRSVHVVGAHGPVRETVLRALGAEATVTHDSVEPLIGRITGDGDTVGLGGDEGAAVGGGGADGRRAARVARSHHDEVPALALLLADSVPAGDALRLLRAAVAGQARWIVCLVEEMRGRSDGADDVHGLEVHTLSLGWAWPLEAVAEYAAGEHEPPLELRDVVRRVARARHDINNPLTSALAQTQLLILEHGDVEVGEELREIETQIKRIAELVADTASIRPRDG